MRTQSGASSDIRAGLGTLCRSWRPLLALASALLASGLGACAHQTTPIAVKARASTIGPSVTPFVPGRASRERKAKLTALAPRLDELYRAEVE